jgi:hypothetical protein
MPVNEVARLPVPDHLEPKSTARNLATLVRGYFYPLYNSSVAFRDLLASVGNKDAITGNRLFDRLRAVDMIKEAATEAKDSLTTRAKEGEIYKHLVHVMGAEGMSLKQRRQAYQSLTHQQAAE